MIVMKYTALVTVAALVFTFLVSGRVGSMRVKFGVSAPTTAGQPDFERAFRVHMNTIEQLVLFIPLLWLASGVIGDLWASAVGAVWIVGRIIYAGGYWKAADKRGPGMIITIISTGVLGLATLWGIVQAFMS